MRTYGRSSRTRAAYYKGGRRHLRRALAAYPDRPPVEALVAMAEDDLIAMQAARERGPADASRLRPGTVRVYRAEMSLIVAVLVRASGQTADTADRVMKRIDAALNGRRGRPGCARTASLKVKDATQDEARAVFEELRRHVLAHRHTAALAAALYVVVGPKIGMRPIELCGAKVEGTRIEVPCAKRARGEPDWRGLDLCAYPASLIEATRALVALAPSSPDVAAAHGWHKGMAESLARACKRIGQRRLAPSSFRHVAIATWEAAGYTASEIARMAGHVDVATARRHYARSRHGWTVAALAQPVGDGGAAPRDATAPERPVDPDWGFDDMPKPAAKPAPSGDAGAAARAWLEAQAESGRALAERLTGPSDKHSPP